MRVWITSGDVCRLFLTYGIVLDDSLVPDAQVSWNEHSAIDHSIGSTEK